MTGNSLAPPSDEQARTLALEPARSFIVQAPAGSGKTELLIQRYLALLARVDHPEEIIAITFTRKAVAEMRQRILAALDAAASGPPPATGHAQRTRRLALAVLERDRQRGWQVINNPGRLKIQTIDSLCAWLTGQMPFLSQQGGVVKTVDDAAALYEEAAIKALGTILSDAFYSDAVQRLLLHLDNDLPRLTALLQAMLGRRDQWLRYLHAADERQPLQAAIAVLVKERLGQLVAAFPPQYAADLLALLDYAAAQLARQGDNSLIQHLVQHEGMTSLPDSRVDDLAAWQAIADLLLTKEGNWRKRLTKDEGFPSPSENKAEAALRKEKKAAMQTLLASLHEQGGALQGRLHDVRLLPVPEYRDADWVIIDALCRLLKIASAQLKLIFAGRGETDFIGMAEAALNALGPPDEPTDLALYLDYQIKHLLLDEFQDISVNQFSLMEGLTAGWQADDGRTVFIVGDPMQSIYGFREAEVGQFIATYRHRRLGDIALTALRLSHNFRSQQGLIDWVNTSFAQALPPHDDVATGAVAFSPSTAPGAAPGQGQVQAGAVRVHAFPFGGQAAEDKKTAEIIQAIRSAQPGDSLALLVRNRSHLEGILPLLRQGDVPYQAVEIDALGEQPYIQDLLALTRAYLYPADRVAWLAVLRAPWCGLRLADLLAIVQAGEHGTGTAGMTIWQGCRQVLRENALAGDAAEILARLVEVFAVALANRQRYTLRDSIESIWCSLGGPATLAGAIQLDNAEAFFKLLAGLDAAGRLDDIGALEQRIARLYALPQADDHNNAHHNPVQVMTMHKAKGLEFDHVILPQLGGAGRAPEKALLIWTLHTDATGRGHLLLSPIGAIGPVKPGGNNGGRADRLRAYLAEMEKRKRRNEAGRLLYVAATRARKSLHLLGQAKAVGGEGKPPSRSLLEQLWPAVAEQFAGVVEQQLDTAVAPSQAAPHALARLAAGWRLPAIDDPVKTITALHDHPPAEPEADIHFDWAGETIKHVGIVAHACLAQLSTLPAAPFNNEYIANSLLQSGVAASALEAASELVCMALDNIQADARGRWLFAETHAQARNEYAVSGLVGGRVMNVVMDRTFIDADGCRWIVDYKTSRHEGEDVAAFLDQEVGRYQARMTLYARIMAGLEERPTMLGLYFPLLKGWRSWRFIA